MDKIDSDTQTLVQQSDSSKQANDGGASLSLENFLPYRLTLLADLVTDALARIYSDRHNIGIPEWRVLATLGQLGPMTAKAVGQYTHMHKTKVSRAVAALEEKGLLARQPDATDKRAAWLRLTDAGKTIHEDLVPAAVDFTRRLEEVLDEQDRQALETILTKLQKRSGELSADMSRAYQGRGVGSRI